jgi:class 3 adenylate cyclase
LHLTQPQLSCIVQHRVFTLLETIYSAFDKIAYRHSVFKIETVGDCYVAVAGLPEERQDHALVVARFARDCLHKMRDLTSKLEVTLGPDTAELELRVGLHSGQVTAGVLRGERSRFQLFGDTVNTAARMESTGVKSCIQISSATAGELKKWKRGPWIRPRDQRISVKGKGEMQTYWLETKAESIQKAKLSKRQQQVKVEMAPLLEEPVTELEEDDLQDDCDSDEDRHSCTMTKTQRLVEWNVVVMGKLLRQILAARGEFPANHQEAQSSIRKVEDEISGKDDGSQTVLTEFKEIVTMPLVRGEDLLQRKDPHTTTLPESVVEQLRHFLTLVAGMYQANPFHNFEHASHVTASARKLLTRIVKAGDRKLLTTRIVKTGDRLEDSGVNLSDLAGHSYGITSDPITQFAVVFSAVIHDAGHPGVPNAVLLQENTRNAQIYKKSIAEQYSVDLVWSLLMKPEYGDLRACIYSTDEELRRFRQLVVNIVMATDIVDKDLQALRKARWETAFATTTVDSTPELDVNRKATIVLEHIIQASDVSHTMQHWHVYVKWNEKFFIEQYSMYKAGRVETDPSIGWYQGEIGFFDFYIIPLAKKLQSCGCFGVSSHEYLNYAMANREEWAREGESIVQEYLARFELLEVETEDIIEA